MITGDNAATTQAIARQSNIDDVAGVLYPAFGILLSPTFAAGAITVPLHIPMKLWL